MRMPAHILCSHNLPDTVTSAEIGAKALQLKRIQGAGFIPPEWLVVTTSAAQLELAPIQERIDTALGRAASIDDLPDVASEIDVVFNGFHLSPTFQRQLNFVVYCQFGIVARLAVRSSAVDEDGPVNSFAGQFASFLNVIPGQIADRVVDVWRSAFSAGALAYRIQKGLPAKPSGMAVIIQRMINARASGVLFTRDPEKSTRKIVISAAYGLGEGVVSNQVETDTYWFGRGEILPDRTIRRKTTCIAMSLNGHGGTTTAAVSDRCASRSVLSLRELFKLRKAGVHLEEAFGSPLDIEWAFDSSGLLHILQARPMTAPSRTAPTNEPRIWDNANIVESYPGLTQPLTYSFIIANYEALFRKAACGMVLSKKEIANCSEIWTQMLGLVHGRVYYNLRSWYAMLAFLPGFQHHRKAWDAMIGITRPTVVTPRKLPWYNRLYSLMQVCRFLLAPGRLERRFFRKFRTPFRRFQSMDLCSLSDQGLIAHFRNMQSEMYQFWHLTLYIDFCAMKYFDWLKRLCRRWTSVECSSLHSDLLCGQPGIESVEPVRSAVAIAEMVRDNPAYRALFTHSDPEEIWQRINSDEYLTPLRQRCKSHLALYGDRCAEELKLETITPTEKPELFIALLADYVQSDLTVTKMKEREGARRTDAENQLRSSVRNPFKRMVVSFVLGKARAAVAGRENTRFARARMYGLARAVFRQLGTRLEAHKVLKSASDIGYLTMSEVFGFCSASGNTADAATLVDARRREYERFAEESVPSRIDEFQSQSLDAIPTIAERSGIQGRLLGTGCSSGVAVGKTWVIERPNGQEITSSDIIVAESTDPSWVFLMIKAGGLMSERGSVLSHTAIIGRELGIPTIVGVEGARRLIPNRSQVRMNGGTGEVVWK